MKYWEEFHDKFGFGDGDEVPPDAWAMRYVYIREINRIAKALGSAVRLFANDRSGLHNSYLIGRAAAKTVENVQELSLCKGLYRGSWDPGSDCTEPDSDAAMDAAIAAAEEMELEDLVSVKVTIAGRHRSGRKARRRAA